MCALISSSQGFIVILTVVHTYPHIFSPPPAYAITFVNTFTSFLRIPGAISLQYCKMTPKAAPGRSHTTCTTILCPIHAKRGLVSTAFSGAALVLFCSKRAHSRTRFASSLTITDTIWLYVAGINTIFQGLQLQQYMQFHPGLRIYATLIGRSFVYLKDFLVRVRLLRSFEAQSFAHCVNDLTGHSTLIPH